MGAGVDTQAGPGPGSGPGVGLPVGERPIEELAAAVCAGAVRLAAAKAVWLGLVAEFDRRGGWAGVGIGSCAQWLSWQCGLAPGAAREHVRVARALGRLPVTAAAFAAGRLSYAKVREISRVADAATESALVEVEVGSALTAGQLERVVRGWRRSNRADAAEAAEDARRAAEDACEAGGGDAGDAGGAASVGRGEDAVEAAEAVVARRVFQWHWESDGMLSVQVRLDAEQGAALLAGVEGRVERQARRDRAAAKKAGEKADATRSANTDGCAEERVTLPRERVTTARCAALVGLVEDGVGVGRRAGDPPRREVVVHVDADVLAADAAAGRAHLEGGPALTAAQVRRMACQAALSVIVTRGGQPLALGRSRRLATAAQRRALLARDGGCARPGCAETRIERLHAHHLRRWFFGGRTDVANMVLLCEVDHGLVHELDLVLTRRSGRLVAALPDGQRIWGPADAAWLAGWQLQPAQADLVGVQPFDRTSARRPTSQHPTSQHPTGQDPITGGPAAGGRERSTRNSGQTRVGATGVGAVVTPLRPLLPTDPGGGEPGSQLPDTNAGTGERMDLHHVVWVLLAHRDYLRRTAAAEAAAEEAA